MAILELPGTEQTQIHYNIPHLPVRLETRRLPSGSADTPHRHEDLEILQVLEGSVRLETKKMDVLLQPGDIFVICTQQMHSLSCGSASTAKYFSLHTNLLSLIDNHAVNMSLLYPVFFDAAAEGYLLPVSSSEYSELRDNLVRLSDFEDTRPLAWPLELSGVLRLLLAGICRSVLPARGNQIPGDEVQILESMVSFISRFYAEKIRLTDIAAAGRVGRSKCCQIFKSFLNLSPIDFLNSYRLSVSRDLLITTPFKVSVIAASCGFSHQSYYTRIFREKYGCTPNAYRMQNTEESPNF